MKAGFKDAAHPSRHEPSLQTLTALELAKCAMALGLLYRDTRRRFSAGARCAALPDEGLPLYPVSGEWVDLQDAEYHGADQFNKQIPQCYTMNHIYTAVLPIALLYLGRHQLVRLFLHLRFSRMNVSSGRSTSPVRESSHPRYRRCAGNSVYRVLHIPVGRKADPSPALD